MKLDLYLSSLTTAIGVGIFVPSLGPYPRFGRVLFNGCRVEKCGDKSARASQQDMVLLGDAVDGRPLVK